MTLFRAPWAAAFLVCAGFASGCGRSYLGATGGGEPDAGGGAGHDASVDVTGDGGREGDATEASAADAQGGDADGGVDGPAEVTTPAPCEFEAGAWAPERRFNGGVAAQPRLVVADFDGDGHLDMAVADQFGNDVVVRLGLGDGTFRTAGRFAVGMSPFRIVAGDVDGDGKLDLALAMNGGYDLASRSVLGSDVGVLLGKGDGTFSPVTDYPIPARGDAGGNLEGVGIAIADLDSDAIPDLATVSISGGLYVFRGTGGGSFAQPEAFDTGMASVYSLVAGDVDGDGVPDLVLSGADLSDGGTSVGVVSVMLTRNGRPSAPASYPVGGLEASEAVIVDLDGDHAPDLAVSQLRGSGVSVLSGRGDGTFGAAVAYPATDSAYAVRAADLDHDGRKDLVVGTAYGVTVLLQASSGSFQPFIAARVTGTGSGYGVTYDTYDFSDGLGVPSVGIGDFDEDGVPDVAVGITEYDVQVLHGTGDGHLQPIEPLHHDGPLDLVAADLDGDGKLDLVVANAGSKDIGVLRGNGDGTFRPEVDYRPADAGAPRNYNFPEALTPADINGDGKLDLVVAEGNNGYGGMAVYFGQGGGVLKRSASWLAGPFGKPVVADFDGDGVLDLASTATIVLDGGQAAGGVLAISTGHGDGTFTVTATYHASGARFYLGAFAAADMNADGIEDLVGMAVSVARGAPSVVSVLLGHGDGTFADAVSSPYDSNDAGTYGGALGIAVGDVNNDGKPDVVAWDAYVNEVLAYPGRGDGSLDAPTRTAVPGAPNGRGVTLADTNGDGNLDVAIVHAGARGGSTEVVLLLGNGDGTFAPAVLRPVGNDTTALVTGDFAGRGRPDIVTCNYASNDMSYLASAPACP